MKKMICLLFITFLSTTINATTVVSRGSWEKNKIYCNVRMFGNYNGTEDFFMTTFSTDQKNEVWNGLFSIEEGMLYTKIAEPSDNVYNCAYRSGLNNAVVGGEKGLEKPEKIQIKGAPSSSLITFACFCKTNPNLLNDCATKITDKTNTQDPSFTICNAGMTDLL